MTAYIDHFESRQDLSLLNKKKNSNKTNTTNKTTKSTSKTVSQDQNTTIVNNHQDDVKSIIVNNIEVYICSDKKGKGKVEEKAVENTPAILEGVSKIVQHLDSSPARKPAPPQQLDIVVNKGPTCLGQPGRLWHPNYTPVMTCRLRRTGVEYEGDVPCPPHDVPDHFFTHAKAILQDDGSYDCTLYLWVPNGQPPTRVTLRRGDPPTSLGDIQNHNVVASLH